MNTVIKAVAVAAIALSTTAALAGEGGNAVSQSRALLEAEFAKARAADRQVSSGIRLGAFDPIVGATLRLGVADSRSLDASAFGRFPGDSRAGR